MDDVEVVTPDDLVEGGARHPGIAEGHRQVELGHDGGMRRLRAGVLEHRPPRAAHSLARDMAKIWPPPGERSGATTRREGRALPGIGA
jgi:hypothetical protein